MTTKATKFEKATETTKRKLPNNARTFKLFPLESFEQHPRGWLNWMKKANYQVTDNNLKIAIKNYFKKIEDKIEFVH